MFYYHKRVRPGFVSRWSPSSKEHCESNKCFNKAITYLVEVGFFPSRKQSALFINSICRDVVFVLVSCCPHCTLVSQFASFANKVYLDQTAPKELSDQDIYTLFAYVWPKKKHLSSCQYKNYAIWISFCSQFS